MSLRGFNDGLPRTHGAVASENGEGAVRTIRHHQDTLGHVLVDDVQFGELLKVSLTLEILAQIRNAVPD